MPLPVHSLPTDPKVKQYLEELNELNARYQFVLKPVLRITKDGIVPLMNIVNVPPEKTKKEDKRAKKST